MTPSSSSFTPRKRFGQHFLTCENALEAMVAAIYPQSRARLLEIGPGLGALTERLIGQAKEFTVIEIDRDLVEKLHRRFVNTPLKICQADVLQFDFSSILSPDRPMCVVGNLPYNISTPLLFRLFEELAAISECFFLLQKEVVDRMCAGPGCKQYGRLSVMTQYYCQAESLFDVAPSAFSPPPKVNSSFIRLKPHQIKPAEADDFAHFSLIVREAFCHRRKMLKRIFKKLIVADTWTQLGIDSTLRPEQLTVVEFVKISNNVSHQ